MAITLLETSLPGLRLVSKGKVRDIYATSDTSTLLFVATDRISAYDVVLRNGIPEKGELLNKISTFWFEKLRDVVPNHVITTDVDAMPEDVKQYKCQLQGRSMLVRKCEVVQIEAIVRGYLTGSAWAEYSKSGTVHGIKLPPGLIESQQLPEPLFTPSTKAAQGQHDENIHPDQAAKLIGHELYAQISSVSLRLYRNASQYAEHRGLILADTKFEFGLLPDVSHTLPLVSNTRTNTVDEPSRPVSRRLLLIDELLTPDSSRYWPKDGYKPGVSQPSFDKQYLRDWLKTAGFEKGMETGPAGKEGEGWLIEEAVVDGTRKRYNDAAVMLMG